MKNTILSVIITIAVVLGGYFTLNTPAQEFSGTSNFDQITLDGNLTTGGLYSTTTSSSTNATLAESEIFGFSTIIVRGASSTATNNLKLPASSTLTTLIPRAGDVYRFNIVNATTTGSSTLTVANNTGLTLSRATSTAIIPVGGTGIVQLIRNSNSNVIATLEITN